LKSEIIEKNNEISFKNYQISQQNDLQISQTTQNQNLQKSCAELAKYKENYEKILLENTNNSFKITNLNIKMRQINEKLLKMLIFGRDLKTQNERTKIFSLQSIGICKSQFLEFSKKVFNSMNSLISCIFFVFLSRNS